MTLSPIRTNEWLEEKLYDLWENYFNDVPRQNLVLIKFGKASATRLGSIKWLTSRTKVKTFLKKKVNEIKIQDDQRVSIITITALYKYREVPENVIEMTIAHEMVHYAHGFHSPLPQKFKHPHKGNVVNKDLIQRGLGDELKSAEDWLKKNWRNFNIAYRKTV